MDGLGCTLYFLLAGWPPFAVASLAQKQVRHTRDELPPLHPDRPDVPVGVERILRTMTAKRPDERYPTGAAAAAAPAPWVPPTR